MVQNRITEVSVLEPGEPLKDMGSYLRDLTRVPAVRFLDRHPDVVSSSNRTNRVLYLTHSLDKTPIAVCVGIAVVGWLILGGVIGAITKSFAIWAGVTGAGATVTNVFFGLIIWNFR